MITKTQTSLSTIPVHLEADLSSIRRCLVAAAINPAFCSLLLDSPVSAIQKGFGGEDFPLSDSTLNFVATIRASTLSEFIFSLNEELPLI
jgi:hypothetical protein